MALIERGKKTNRVKVKRKRVHSPGGVNKAYEQDPSVRGHVTVTFCVSFPAEELVELDVLCAKVQMARSHFIRQAVKHFAAWIANPNREQAQRWKEALR